MGMVILLSFPSRTSVLRGRVASKVALDRTGELDNNSPTGITRLLLIVAFYYRISHLRTRFSIACQALQRIHKEPFHILICCNLCSPQAPSGASFGGTLLIFMCSLDHRRMYFRVLVFFKGDGIISPTVGRKRPTVSGPWGPVTS